MPTKSMLCIFGLWMISMIVSVSFPSSSGAVTWGYPADSTLGQCLASKVMKFDIFPSRESALATIEAEKAAAHAYCDALPDPKPGWCGSIYSWEWNNGSYQLHGDLCCSAPYGCSLIGCSGVTDSGFSCNNCRNYGEVENGTWKKTNYWYYICGPTHPPPSQQPDVPITTEVTDKNTGGECAGRCDATVNDGPMGPGYHPF